MTLILAALISFSMKADLIEKVAGRLMGWLFGGW